MKKLLLLCLSLFCLSITGLFAQCEPADLPADVLVDPLEFDTVCLNDPYNFVITVNVPDMLTDPPVPFDSVAVNPAGGSILGLPDGLSYACNPPSCSIAALTAGCFVITGTPTNPDQVGNNPLDLLATVYTPFGALDIQLSTVLQPEPGQFDIYVKPEGTCSTVSTNNLLKSQLSVSNAPNPFSSMTQIEIQAGISGDMQLNVYDLLGKTIHSEAIRVVEGDNIIDFDGSNLADGMYIYTIGNGQDVVSQKMTIRK